MKKHYFVRFFALVTILFVSLGFVFPTTTNSQGSAFAVEKPKTETSFSDTIEVLSYVDVFEEYYDLAKEKIIGNIGVMPFTFEQYCEGYYSYNYSIAYYTDLVVEYAEKYILNKNENISLYDSGSSNPEEADYILTSFNNYVVTPKSVFKREPNYSGYNGNVFDYTTLKNGDIIYETKTFLSTGHTAIISDISHQSEYGYYVQTIEAVQPWVSFGMLDDNRMVQFGVIILRVFGATATQSAEAVSFCFGQVGKPYSLNLLRHNLSYDSAGWYCSELCYAAYKNVGIDIGMKKSKYGLEETISLGCVPGDIYAGYNTYEKCILNGYFVDIQLVCGDRWQVRIINNTGISLYISYNKTMCFENDAKNWSLSNTNDIRINNGSSTTVTIKENWFATDIAVCVPVGNNKYITYAHDLSDDPYSMRVYYSKI